MAKIAVDIRMMGPKTHGIGRYIRNLLREFALIPNDHLFFLLHNQAPPNLESAKYIFKIVSSAKFSLKSQIEIPYALKKISPDLFHAPSIDVPFFCPFPSVMTIHDLIPFVFPEYYPKYALLYLPLLRFAAARARIILVPSESTLKDVNRILGTPLDKIRVIPDAADAVFTCKKSARDEDILEKLNLPEKFFLTVANPRPHKNLAALLKALTFFKDKECVLAVVGEISNKDRVLINELNIERNIRLLGHITDESMAAAYRAATAFVFPSFYEGFGLPVLEAFASGCPVICSDTSSLPEIAGDGALLINPKDIKQIAEAMEKILSNCSMREQLSARALNRAGIFSWRKTAELTLKAYEEALE